MNRAPIVVTVAAVVLAAAVERAAAAPAPVDQRSPAIAYNSDTDAYFAVWSDDRGPGRDLYGKLLFSNGMPVGGPSRGGTAVIRTSDVPGRPVETSRDEPALVYNADRDEYFLVWSDSASEADGADVYGVRVSSAGYAQGVPRLLAGGPGDQAHPAVAYEASQQLYMVVWSDNARDIDDVWGLRVRVTGTPYGSKVALAQGASNADEPTIAARGCCPAGFLVAWVDDRTGNRDIYGRRIAVNGLPVGGAQGNEFVMAGTGDDEFEPNLDPRSGTLLYNVFSPVTGLDILGMELYDAGRARPGRPIGIAVPAADQAEPASSVNSMRGDTLVLYADNRSGQYDLYALRVRNSRPQGRDYAVVSDGAYAVE